MAGNGDEWPAILGHFLPESHRKDLGCVSRMTIAEREGPAKADAHPADFAELGMVSKVGMRRVEGPSAQYRTKRAQFDSGARAATPSFLLYNSFEMFRH